MLRDVINRELTCVEPNSRVTEAAMLMEKKDIGCVLVLENGKPRGVLTDRDIVLRCVAKNVDVDDCTVENVMTETLQTVKETDGIFDVIETMRGAGIRRIPVVDAQGHAVGMVSFGDMLAILSKELYELTEGTTRPLDVQRMAA
jgi:CBS domain-containing protein